MRRAGMGAPELWLEEATLAEHPALSDGLREAERAASTLRRAGIAVGVGEGTVCGVRDAFVRGIVALDPRALGLSPWPFLAKSIARGYPSIVLRVCARRAAEAARVTGLPCVGPGEAAGGGVVLRADPLTSFVAALAADRALDVGTFLRSVSPTDSAALELLDGRNDAVLPWSALDDAETLALRRCVRSSSLDHFATMDALSQPGSNRLQMLTEFVEPQAFRWSWPATAYFEGLFASSGGLPVWHEQLDECLVRLIGCSPLEAPLVRASWHRAAPGAAPILETIAAAIRELGFSRAVTEHLVRELDWRNKAAFSRASYLPQTMLLLACARAQLQHPRGYAVRLRDHASALRKAFAGA